MPVAVLDAEPLSRLAHARKGSGRLVRATALLEVAGARTELFVPAPVLVELYRGNGRDAAVDRALRSTGMTVVDTTKEIARIAGRLLGRHRLDSRHAVDAVIVATTLFLGGGVILTGDPTDLARLAAGHPAVRVIGL